MSGALDLTQPWHLFEKMEREAETLAACPEDTYAAINALRDAYHLREWIWHGRLEHDTTLHAEVMGERGNEEDWNIWVKQHFPDFTIVHELCNGSKHFLPHAKDTVRATHRPGYGSPLFAYDVGPLGYGVRALFVQTDGGRIISIDNLVSRIRDFWNDQFEQFPGLR
jgi:hypothetical protein